MTKLVSQPFPWDRLGQTLTYFYIVTIATPILWGCLEISVGVVSTCLPALMPLILTLVGKKPTKKGTPTYNSYADGKSNRSRFKRFNRIVDLGGPAPLPEAEGLELSTVAHDRLDDNDDARLVGGAKNPRDILITNHIIQVSQANSTEKEEYASHRTAENATWAGHQPPQAHMARSNV